jgi:hypothetical protein
MAASDPRHLSDDPAVDGLAIPPFDGYPYLLTQVVPGHRHLILLPRDLPSPTLRELARIQVRANRLPTALVLDEDFCLYLRTDGIETLAPEGPNCGLIVSGYLRPPAPFAPSPELVAREDRLEAYASEYHRSGSFRSDPRDGGWLASDAERIRLAGRGPDNLPKGLTSCLRCGDMRGNCLYRIEPDEDYVVQVYCRCANWNQCAQCGDPLHEWRLNAVYFDRYNGHVSYAPGHKAFWHTCHDR